MKENTSTTNLQEEELEQRKTMEEIESESWDHMFPISMIACMISVCISFASGIDLLISFYIGLMMSFFIGASVYMWAFLSKCHPESHHEFLYQGDDGVVGFAKLMIPVVAVGAALYIPSVLVGYLSGKLFGLQVNLIAYMFWYFMMVMFLAGGTICQLNKPNTSP